MIVLIPLPLLPVSHESIWSTYRANQFMKAATCRLQVQSKMDEQRHVMSAFDEQRCHLTKCRRRMSWIELCMAGA
eukprot:1162015-Pelagomonas_calceolata.AAC.12